MPLRLLGALTLALLLNRQRRGSDLYRAGIYLPTVMPAIAYALIWQWVYNPRYGPLNQILGSIGLPQPLWLADSHTALPAIVIMAGFQLGEGFIILLAGLQIPKDYYDAQSMGLAVGASFGALPCHCLCLGCFLLSIHDSIASIQGSFAPAYLMTDGGPYYATLFCPS